MWSFLSILVSASLAVVSLRAGYVGVLFARRLGQQTNLHQMIRWAGDFAMNPDRRLAQRGVLILESLAQRRDLASEDAELIYAVLEGAGLDRRYGPEEGHS